jgi:hypothetical protein
MNERIKELAEQAGASYYNAYTGPLLSPKDIEKFAELIVQECINVAMRSVGDDEPKEAWYLIQEHFGVDE